MSLYVSRLTLSHFRSHQLSKIEFDQRPVAIFGANGAGKTNILEAISLLSPGRGLRRASASEITRRPEAIGWKLKADIHNANQHHELHTWSENGAARKVALNGKSTNQIAIGKISQVLWLVPAQDRLWIEGAEGRRRFLDRAVLSFKPEHAQISMEYERAMRQRNRLLKDGQRDSAWYLALETQMAQAGMKIHHARQSCLQNLMQAQKNTCSQFPVADLRLTQNESSMPATEAELREALHDNRSRDLIAGRSLIGPHRSDLSAIWQTKGTPAKDCSTGEQKALLVSLILANARALPQAPILLLDEVSAHLDPNRRAALYDEICALKAQAFMTGTEQELFSTLGDRAQYMRVDDDDGSSHIENIAADDCREQSNFTA